jgi:hypothetical protein
MLLFLFIPYCIDNIFHPNGGFTTFHVYCCKMLYHHLLIVAAHRIKQDSPCMFDLLLWYMLFCLLFIFFIVHRPGCAHSLLVIVVQQIFHAVLIRVKFNFFEVDLLDAN